MFPFVPLVVGFIIETQYGAEHRIDALNAVLLVRLRGSLTDDSVAGIADAVRKCSATTNARAFITDVSSIIEFPVSTEFLRHLAKQEPVVTEVDTRPSIIVASKAHAYGLTRMFQTMGESTRPHLQVVRTLHDALGALGIQSPHFEKIA